MTYQNLRRKFADSLHAQMKLNNKIWVITGDLGYKVWDETREEFPDRFINTGAAEQAMMGLAVGLALKGQIPFVYSITTFLLYRPFETIRNYIHNEKIPVRLIGSGRDRDYSHDGFSHWAEEDKQIMQLLNNIHSRWPETEVEVEKLVKEMISKDKPWYVNLKR
jgi:transketolase